MIRIANSIAITTANKNFSGRVRQKISNQGPVKNVQARSDEKIFIRVCTKNRIGLWQNYLRACAGAYRSVFLFAGRVRQKNFNHTLLNLFSIKGRLIRFTASNAIVIAITIFYSRSGKKILKNLVKFFYRDHVLFFIAVLSRCPWK